MPRLDLRAAWTARDPALAVKLGTWFALGGGAFNLFALLIPNATGSDLGLVVTVIVAVLLLAVGGVGAVRPRLAPPLLWALEPAIGAVVITVTAIASSDTSTAAQVFFLWPVLMAAYLLPRGTAIFVLGLSGAGELAMVLRGASIGQGLYDAVALILTLSTMAAVVLTLRDRVDRLVGRLAEQAMQDTLTQLPNRRAFDERLGVEFETARLTGRPVSLLSIDLDNLKVINDLRGHSAGDTALRQLAAALTRAVRAEDFIARLGGDEFVALLPGCSSVDAVHRADQLRTRLGAVNSPALTVSVGIATYSGAVSTVEDFLACANAALYDAKRAGRDRAAVGACSG